jgi:hypothetical protein
MKLSSGSNWPNPANRAIKRFSADIFQDTPDTPWRSRHESLMHAYADR